MNYSSSIAYFSIFSNKPLTAYTMTIAMIKQVEAFTYGPLLISLTLHDLSKSVHCFSALKLNAMFLTLSEHKEHLALGLLTPLHHHRVWKGEHFLMLIDVDKVRNLQLTDIVNDCILLVFRHDQLVQVHVLATKDRHFPSFKSNSKS